MLDQLNGYSGAVKAEDASRVQIAGRTVFQDNTVGSFGGDRETRDCLRLYSSMCALATFRFPCFSNPFRLKQVGKLVQQLNLSPIPCRLAAGRKLGIQREIDRRVCFHHYSFLGSVPRTRKPQTKQSTEMRHSSQGEAAPNSPPCKRTEGLAEQIPDLRVYCACKCVPGLWFCVEAPQCGPTKSILRVLSFILVSDLTCVSM